MKKINYALIQDGYCAFGVGSTIDEANRDAVGWIEGVDSPDDVESLLVPRVVAVDGSFCIIGSDDMEFDDYMKNQHAFKKIDGEWWFAE